MRRLREWILRFGGLLNKQRKDRELEDEIENHLQLHIEDNLRLGMTPEEARRQAMIKLGGIESTKEAYRDQRGLPVLETLWQDIRFGVRILRKNRGFTGVAVLTLALGIGATTALFSVAYGVLISPYPYAKPHEIWAPGLRSVGGSAVMRRYRLSEIEEMGKMSAFAHVMATVPGNVLLSGEYAPENVTGIRVTGNTFSFLGVPPLLGRGIYPSDISSGGVPEPVVVLSYKRWQRLFGSDPNVLGRTLRLDDRPHSIIGVMPPRFGWWTDDGVWLPLGTETRDSTRAFPIARLKARTPPGAAEQQLNGYLQERAKLAPSEYPREEFTAMLTNYLDMTAASGEMQRSLVLLFGAVVFLLLIACANVANLQLARATVRLREMAIRLSVGAGRARLVRQLLTESVLLSSLAGALGLAFSVGIIRLMVTLMPGFYLPNEARIEINGYVLGFCVLISMFTGIVFGLAPALESSKPNLVGSLKDDSRAAATSAGGRLRAGLVVAEVAMATVLLVSGGLTLRSFIALQKVELGFHAAQVTTIDLPTRRYATWDQRNQFAQEVLEYVQNLPGVQAAQIGNGGLPFGGPNSRYGLAGREESEADSMVCNLVSADYLQTLGIRLIQGRMLEAAEVRRADYVAVINEAAARLWPAGEDPIGKQLRLDLLKNPGGSVLSQTNASPYVTVVGVVANTRNDGLRNEARPAALLPFTLLAPPGRTLAFRTTGDSTAVISALRSRLLQIDSQQPVQNPQPLEAALLNQRLQPRFITALFSLFAAFGLALAAMGIYSVLSYLVTRRTREIGIRVALGAQHRDIIRLIFGSGGPLVGVGIAVGTAMSLIAARLLGSQLNLFGVTAADPVTFCGVIVLLGVVATAACLIPARRAGKVDPMVALRYE